MKFGNVELENGIFLAPMAGISDSSFRRICKSMGAEYLVSEMVSAKAIVYEEKSKTNLQTHPSKTAPLAKVKKEEYPMAVQIFGGDPEFVAEGARLIAENIYRGSVSETSPCAIDINMGCPVSKIVGNKEGSALLLDSKRASEIVKKTVQKVNIPISVKMRIGFDKEHINAVEFAKMLEDSGASFITVHGRTREQQYAPSADWNVINEVKKAVNIPIVANGDIFTPEDAIKAFEITGADGIMIGRGAIGNPFIFREIKEYIKNGRYDVPSAEERIKTALFQIEDMIREKGERVGIAESRKHLSYYIKGMYGSASYRNAVNSVSTFAEMQEILEKLLKDNK